MKPVSLSANAESYRDDPEFQRELRVERLAEAAWGVMNSFNIRTLAVSKDAIGELAKALQDFHGEEPKNREMT